MAHGGEKLALRPAGLLGRLFLFRFSFPFSPFRGRFDRFGLAIDLDGLFHAERAAQLAHETVVLFDDAGNVGIKIINNEGEVEFVVADIALSSYDGVWLAGLPETATIITVGQGYVAPGSVVAAIPERDVETAVAIKDNEETD